MKKISGIILVVVEGILMSVISIILDHDVTITINVTIIVGFFVMFLTAVVLLFIYFLKSENFSSKNKELESKIGDLTKESNELNKTIKGLYNNQLPQGSNQNATDGIKLVLMSLTQPLYEPVKIGLLKKAYEKYNNILAALILANIYCSGIEYRGKSYIAKDMNKAAEIYLDVMDIDNFGVSEWQLGWMYENNSISSSDILPENERRIKAYEYYERSANKKFPKAYNSIGKYYLYGWGNIKVNFAKCMRCFTRAAENGDVYGIMNCGHINLKEYYKCRNTDYLNSAEFYFSNASEMKNTEGNLNLGIIYQIRYELNSEDDCLLQKSKEYYIMALSNVRNQYSATAYYMLGKLIDNNTKLLDDQSIINALGKCQYSDLVIECFTRSYLIFQEVKSNK